MSCIPQGYGEEDYLIFDCPGQIELYSHVSAFKSLVDWLKNQVRHCTRYCNYLCCLCFYPSQRRGCVMLLQVEDKIHRNYLREIKYGPAWGDSLHFNV